MIKNYLDLDGGNDGIHGLKKRICTALGNTNLDGYY
jgi:hypothetical protein